MDRYEPVDIQVYLSVTFKLFTLVETANKEFGLPIVLKDKSPESMNFGLSLRKELARFTRFLRSKSVTNFPGRLFTQIFPMQKQFKLFSWAADPSTELFNVSMLLDHFSKLELLLRIGLKTSTLNLGVMWIALLGIHTILSTCALFHAAPVTIYFELIMWSGFKLSCKRPSRDVSRKLVTRSCLVTTGSKVIGLIDNF